jgi:hypothetical protein
MARRPSRRDDDVGGTAGGQSLGPPIAYLALNEGTAVYDRRGRHVGVVEHVLTDEPHDIFEGVIVHTLPLPGRHLFADAEQIAELRERGVLLSVERDALHAPSASPAALSATPDDTVESPLHARLRRAWDWLSGRGS